MSAFCKDDNIKLCIGSYSFPPHFKCVSPLKLTNQKGEKCGDLGWWMRRLGYVKMFQWLHLENGKGGMLKSKLKEEVFGWQKATRECWDLGGWGGSRGSHGFCLMH